MITSAQTAMVRPPSQPRPALVLLCLLLCALPLVAGCVTGKDPQVARQENAKLDMERIRDPEGAPKTASAKRDAKAEAPKTSAKPASPLGLEEAVSFAVERNLETVAAAQERAVQDEMATGAKYRLLPNLIVDADRSQKSWNVASYSISAQTGQMSLEPSISTDLNIWTANVALSWDLLNLAVNIQRWKQAEGRVETAAERLRRVKQDVTLNVTRAYLKASVAKDAAERAHSLLEQAKERRDLINRQIQEGVLSKVDGLQSDISITEMMIRLKTYISDYRTAMAELAEQMGLKPEDMPDLKPLDLAKKPAGRRFDIPALEREGLTQRPELYSHDIEQRIALQDAQIALIQMFPAITPYVKYSYDSNTFLSINDWYIAGVRLSWDLFSIPRLTYERFAAQKQAELVAKRRMRIALAVITQIRLSIIEFQECYDRLQLAADLERERLELLNAVRDQVRYGKLKESMLLEEDQRYLNARLQHLTNYAGTIVALARLDNSLGRDLGQTGPRVPEPEPDGPKAETKKPGQPAPGERRVSVTKYGSLKNLEIAEGPSGVVINLASSAKLGECRAEYLDEGKKIAIDVEGQWTPRSPLTKAAQGESAASLDLVQEAGRLRLVYALAASGTDAPPKDPVIARDQDGLRITITR